jgi:hypothetical protein
MSRLEELYERQRDGTLDHAEQAELAVLLDDPEHGRALVRLMALDGAVALSQAQPRRRVAWISPRWVRVAAVIAVCLGLGIVVASHMRTPPGGETWTISSAASDAAVVHGQHGQQGQESPPGQHAPPDLPLAAGDRLNAGDRLQGRATVTLPDGTRIDAGSDAEFEPLGDRPGIRLLTGRVAIAAHTRPSGPALAVDTPYGLVEVRGTHYAVAADSLRVVVAVQEGTVAFLHAADPTLLMTAGMGVCATAVSRTPFTLPSASFQVDFTAPGIAWSGTAVAGGYRPVFHHRDTGTDHRAVWGITSPPATGSGFVALGAGLDVTLRYDAPQPCDAFVIQVIASAADRHDFRANLQADVTCPAGSDQILQVPAARFTRRIGAGPIDRGDEVVVALFLMLMDSDHQLLVHALSLTPTAH